MCVPMLSRVLVAGFDHRACRARQLWTGCQLPVEPPDAFSLSFDKVKGYVWLCQTGSCSSA